MTRSSNDGLALPDRARFANKALGIGDALGNTTTSFPGGFEREDIRNLAARELGISSDVLLNLVNDNARSIQSYVLASDTSPGRDLLTIIMDVIDSDIGRLSIHLGWPFIGGEAREHIADMLQEYGSSPRYGQALSNHLLKVVAYEVQQVCSETARFELNLAISQQIISRSDIPETIKAYARLLADEEYVSYILDKYPLLPVHLNRRLRLIATAVKSFAERLHLDMHDLHVIAGVSDGDLVSRIFTTLGDSHLGGARVCIVQFGSGLRVVYKPRAVQGEAAFQGYLSWANSRSELLMLRTIWVLERDGYGWMEFVEPNDATTDQHIEDYYLRYGSLVALLHSVAGTDIHYENLIASGDQPVIVDLETIIQPLAYNNNGGGQRRYILNLDYFADTPLYTAMFDPAFLSKSLNGSPLNALQYVGDAEDKLAFGENGALIVIKDYDEVEIGPNALKRNGRPLNFGNHVDLIVRGYRERMTELILGRSEIINTVLPSIFGSISIRVIFRYTAQYASFVGSLYSPYCMESVRNTEEVLSSLWAFGIATSAASKLIPAEYRDIWNGDIPYFSSGVNSCSTIDSSGYVHDAVLELPGLEAVRTRLLSSSLATLREQTDMLEFCLRQSSMDRMKPSAPESQDSIKTWRDLYREIAERIIVRGDRVLYMEPVTTRGMTISQGMLENDFGSGLAGVVFSLAYCSHFDDDLRFHEKIRSLAHLAFLREAPRRYEIGACIGTGGLIYLAAHLGSLWDDPYYFRVGAHLAAQVASVCWYDRHFDVFSGAAGAVLAVDALMEATGTDTLLPILDKLVRHLMEHAVVVDGKATWTSSIPSHGPSTGFAHGVSGIAYALTRAYRRLHGESLESLIRAAERFIHSCFNSENNTWSEDAGGTATTMEVWCHGAPGISLFYDEVSQVFKDDVLLQRCTVAQGNVVRFASFENDSVCHGTLGNVDLLMTMNGRNDSRLELIGGDVTLDKIASELAGRSLICGNDRRHESLSLFTGISGGIYQLLRLARDGRLPSISTFQGPCKNGD